MGLDMAIDGSPGTVKATLQRAKPATPVQLVAHRRLAHVTIAVGATAPKKQRKRRPGASIALSTKESRRAAVEAGSTKKRTRTRKTAKAGATK